MEELVHLGEWFAYLMLLKVNNIKNVETSLIGRAKRAPHWGVQSRFRVIYVYMYICRYVSYVKLTA